MFLAKADTKKEAEKEPQLLLSKVRTNLKLILVGKQKHKSL
jgi:hypothetical protein